MDMPLKPQVLQDLAADVDLAAAVPTQSWRDPRRDTIQLEDESGRICIVGKTLLEQPLCTGIVVAILGSETSSEEFDVIDIIYAGNTDLLYDREVETVEEERNLIIEPTGHHAETYIAFLSGLQAGLPEGESSLMLDLLADYLCGELLEGADQQHTTKISTLVMVGNNISPSTMILDDAMSRKLTKNKKYGYDSALFDPRPIASIDGFLDEICHSLDIVLLPGETDPTNSTLPQQPINKIMLPQASKHVGSSLQLATNPTFVTAAQCSIFATSGQTIDDIIHYVNTDPIEITDASNDSVEADVLDVVECTIKWGHVAPTAPDTLWTYPYSDKDPFILSDCPDIYVVGNRTKFEYRNLRQHRAEDARICTIISVPSFHDSGNLILLNTRTRQVELINFSNATTTSV